MSPSNRRQGEVPKGARLITQRLGTAPGLICEVGEKVIYALPGVPHEMREMVQRVAQGGMTRDEARRARKEEIESAPRPQPFVFDYESEDGSFQVRIRFRRSQVSGEELAAALRAILRKLESSSLSSSAA